MLAYMLLGTYIILLHLTNGVALPVRPAVELRKTCTRRALLPNKKNTCLIQ